MPTLTKVEELVFGLAAIAMVFFIISGLVTVANSVGGHHDHGVRGGLMKAGVAAVVLAFLFTGTNFINTWANWFS